MPVRFIRGAERICWYFFPAWIGVLCQNPSVARFAHPLCRSPQVSTFAGNIAKTGGTQTRSPLVGDIPRDFRALEGWGIVEKEADSRRGMGNVRYMAELSEIHK